MMKTGLGLCLIGPVSLRQFIETNTDSHFLIATIASKDEVYKNWYTESDRYKIIDNGAYEDKDRNPMGSEDLISMAIETKSNEICAPDKMFNRTDTIVRTAQFLTILSSEERKKFTIMGIPQGKDVPEWISCYKDITCMEGIDTVGLPIWLDRKGGRPAVVAYMSKKNILKEGMDHHLLGLDRPAELFWYSNNSVVRSVDTSLPISCAWDKITLNPIGAPPKHKRVPLINCNDKINRNLLIHNVEVLRYAARGFSK